MKKFLFIFVLAIYFYIPKSFVVAADGSYIREVIMVRGSKMTVCPYNGYTTEQKTRIADSQPVYNGNEYFSFHPNPVLTRENTADCKEILYGQLEFVPFGKEPTYIPTEYIYGIDNIILREDKVLLAKPQVFSDEKIIYKKVQSFKAQDDVTGLTVTVPNTLFWFKGSEVYGKIGDVDNGVIEYKGQYYRADGNQLFINHVVIWTNPNPAPSGSPPPASPTPTAEVVTVPVTPAPIPTWYRNGITWKQIEYSKTIEDTLRPDDLQSWLNPPGRLIGYELDLPGYMTSAQGITAQLRSCGNTECTEKGFDEIMFIVDKDGRSLDSGWKNTRLDLNTEYFRTNRKIYLLVGSMNAPVQEGSRFRFYWGTDEMGTP